jgi:hypothetical protein
MCIKQRSITFQIFIRFFLFKLVVTRLRLMGSCNIHGQLSIQLTALSFWGQYCARNFRIFPCKMYLNFCKIAHVHRMLQDPRYFCRLLSFCELLCIRDAALRLELNVPSRLRPFFYWRRSYNAQKQSKSPWNVHKNKQQL